MSDENSIGKQALRNIPESTLDLNMRMIDGVWGRDELPNSFKDKLKETRYVINTDGSHSFVDEDLWGLLGFFTRDLRLGNLDNQGVLYCEYYLNLANDLLAEGFKDPFIVCLGRVASRLELSQSRGGFFRKIINTLFYKSEENKSSVEPKKKSILSSKGGV